MSKLNHVPRSIVCLLAVCFAGIGIHSADAAEPNQELSKSAGNGDHTVGPDYRLDPDLTDRENPKGQSFEFVLPLAESKIFRGDDPSLSPSKPVRKQRKIFVYVPAAYKDGTKAPVLVTLDGPSRLELVRNALDPQRGG